MTDDISEKHTIIQFAESLFRRFLSNEDERANVGNEAIVFGLLFARTIGISDEELAGMAAGISEDRNNLLKKTIFWLQELFEEPKSSKCKISKMQKSYFKSNFEGSINNAKANELIGDILSATLLDISFHNDRTYTKIITEDLIDILKVGKKQGFLISFFGLFNRDYSFIDLDFQKEYRNLSRFSKTSAALAQFLEYEELKKNLLREESRDSESFRNSYLTHLKFLKDVSSDTFQFIEQDKEILRPSDFVLMRFFYIATVLVMTDYMKTISLNEPSTAVFVKEVVGKEGFFLELVDNEVKRRVANIIDPKDELRTKVSYLLNPLRISSKYIGLLSSWVLWDLSFLVIVLLSAYNYINVSYVGLFLFGKENIPLIILVAYLLASLGYLVVDLSLMYRTSQKP